MNNLVTEEMINNTKTEINNQIQAIYDLLSTLAKHIGKLADDIELIIQGGIWESEEKNRKQILNTKLENLLNCQVELGRYYTSIQNAYREITYQECEPIIESID